MDEVQILVLGQAISFVVAGKAVLAGNLPGSAGNVAVAPLAVHFVGQDVAVIKAVGWDFGDIVTGLAAGKVLLPGNVLKVAQKTGGRGHCKVLALNDLRMTGGAAQLLAALEILEVMGVVKADGAVGAKGHRSG
jgi:hypothetical protein